MLANRKNASALTMKTFAFLVTLSFALPSVSFADANVKFDLNNGDLFPGLPDMYHSNPIGFDSFVIEPGDRQSIWVIFDRGEHLEIIDDPPNTDGVERLRTHISGKVIGDVDDTTELWVDVTLSGASGHLREAFRDDSTQHLDRPPAGTNDGGPADGPDFRDNDWDGAYDDSGQDVWTDTMEDIMVDRELHTVNDGFIVETWADDLTDESYIYHDIHWDITNHGEFPVEIFEVEFWQNGNIIQTGVWIPEPSTTMMLLIGLLSLAICRRSC